MQKVSTWFEFIANHPPHRAANGCPAKYQAMQHGLASVVNHRQSVWMAPSAGAARFSLVLQNPQSIA
jgi:hypothetical protein